MNLSKHFLYSVRDTLLTMTGQQGGGGGCSILHIRLLQVDNNTSCCQLVPVTSSLIYNQPSTGSRLTPLVRLLGFWRSN